MSLPVFFWTLNSHQMRHSNIVRDTILFNHTYPQASSLNDWRIEYIDVDQNWNFWSKVFVLITIAWTFAFQCWCIGTIWPTLNKKTGSKVWRRPFRNRFMSKILHPETTQKAQMFVIATITINAYDKWHTGNSQTSGQICIIFFYFFFPFFFTFYCIFLTLSASASCKKKLYNRLAVAVAYILNMWI